MTAHRVDLQRELRSYESALGHLENLAHGVAHEIADLKAVIAGAREETGDYELVPRELLADLTAFVERAADERWLASVSGAESVLIDAQRLRRALDRKSSNGRAAAAAIEDEVYGPLDETEDEMAPTGEAW